MIKLINNDLERLYLGNKAVIKAYLGDDLVYELKPPEGYTRLEYIRGTRTGSYPATLIRGSISNASINGVTYGSRNNVNAGYYTVVRHRYTNSSAYQLIGHTSTSALNNNQFTFRRSSDNKFYVTWGTTSYPAADERPSFPANTWMEASVNFYNSHKWWYKSELGEEAEGELGEITTNSNGTAFNNYGFNMVGYNYQCRAIDVKIGIYTRAKNLVSIYVPVRREEDGFVGMYDILSDYFAAPYSGSSSTTYNYTAGPNYVYP